MSSGANSSDRAALLARIRAALRSQVGTAGDDADIDLDTLNISGASGFGEVAQSTVDALASRLGGDAGDGSPLADLFSSFPDDAANRAGLSLLNGLTQGPIAIAQNLAQVLGMSQNRAETIARNELIGSYRDAQMANYRANSDVVGQWMWSAAIASACIMCVEMDGTIHNMDEDLMDHVCGRCAPLPITKSWDDILSPYGISADGIPETSITESYGSGHDWFMQQDAATQASIMGPAKYEAWRSGDISLNDLVGVREDGAWGNSLYERSLKEMGLDAQDYLPFRLPRETGLGPQGAEAVQGARAAIPEPELVRVDLGGGMFTYVDPYENPFSAAPNMAGRDTGWQDINDVMAKLRGQKPTGEPLELREPGAAAAKTSYTHADLSGKTMAELRQIAKDAGVAPARSKADTIQRILDKQGTAAVTPAERVTALRRDLDERMAEREALYDKQHDLVAEQDKLENQQRDTAGVMQRAERQAQMDLYRQTLDQSNPEVKQYLKDLAAHDKAKADIAAAKAEQDRLERVMARLSNNKASAEYTKAKADYDAAVAAQKKAEKASDRAWNNLWTKSPGVYKPEFDSIAGFENRFANPITHYTSDFRPVRTPAFTPEQIASNRFVVAARQDIANLDKRLAEVKADIKALDKPIKDINKQIEKQLAQIRDVQATLREGGEVVDTMRPFSDVIALPEGRQPPNATMEKLDFRMHEPRAVTKGRIIDDINARLKNNPDWQAYVSRMKTPERLGQYHQYVHVQASEKDTKSAKFVADLIRKWGVGYSPGSPQWVAQQLAVKEEFGLDAAIHAMTADQLRAGEAFYAENGPALRAFMRAMYDNTQQWFADNGITEIELYRGFGWAESSTAVPHGINWGPIDKQNYGVADLELNPYQSFSADINISQGTGGAAAAAGFAGGGFGGGNSYSLLIGAKVPVDRILSTAQTGFGAKLESEIVVMGRATDTVAYRAGTRVESALLREADVQAVGERETVYSLADGTAVRVAANADGTFTLTYQDGPQAKLGTLKLGSSKTYKTEKGVNKALASMRFSNTYVAPTELAVREGEEAAAGLGAAADGLAARIDSIPVDATVADMQDWLKEQLPNVSTVDLMGLDAQTARLVANASANLIGALPEVGDNLVRIAAQDIRSDALAMVSPDGLSILINTGKWTDLESLAERTPGYAEGGWWVAQTPEQIIGHEIGHALQINYGISNDTWLAAMERVIAGGGNPLVSEYAGDKIEENFAETFALLVYSTPTDAQLPIAREMAQLLSDNGIDYNALRAAVGVSPLDLSE